MQAAEAVDLQAELAELLNETSETQSIELDAEALEAVRAAEDVMSSYSVELLHEVEFDESVANKAADAFDSLLNSVNADQVESALIVADTSAASETEVEDFQAGAGFRKYDEEVSAAMSLDQQAAIAPFKLTKQELSSLVPKVSKQIDYTSLFQQHILQAAGESHKWCTVL